MFIKRLLFTTTDRRALLNTLGLGEDATRRDIRRRYLQLAMKHHPDRTTDPLSHDQYIRIKDAYSKLMEQCDYKSFKGPQGQYRAESDWRSTFKGDTTSKKYSVKTRQWSHWDHHSDKAFEDKATLEKRQEDKRVQLSSNAIKWSLLIGFTSGLAFGLMARWS